MLGTEYPLRVTSMVPFVNLFRKAAFSDKLKEVKIAEKHQDKWRDINAYMKTRRDKLKEEEKK
jgi:hypothetical protein